MRSLLLQTPTRLMKGKFEVPNRQPPLRGKKKRLNNNQAEFLNFLGGEMNERYEKEHLSKTKKALKKTDPLKWFFYKYGYETGGNSGSKAAKMAMVKTIAVWKEKGKVNPAIYIDFFSRSKNSRKKNNPGKCKYLYDQINASSTWLPVIIKNIRKGNLVDSYNNLVQISGVGHKIAALFIRDIISLTHNEDKIFRKLPEGEKIKKYLYAFPVDIWVETISDEMKIRKTKETDKRYKIKKLQGKLQHKAIKLIQLSLDSKVSPLKVNAGAWYLGARIVADKKRLKQLMQKKSIRDIEKEVKLIEDVLGLE